MSYEDDYESRREKRREEERSYRSDVWYEVWRAGGNPDSISDERIQDSRDAGYYPEEAAHRELKAQRPRQSQEEEQQEPDGY